VPVLVLSCGRAISINNPVSLKKKCKKVEPVTGRLLHFSLMTSPAPIKVVFIGDTGVGKTSIIRRYKKEPIMGVMPTITGEAISVIVAAHQTPLSVWDTPGQTVYASIMPIYIRRAAVVVIVYDMTNPSTFANVAGWIDAANSVQDDATIMIVGNKQDCPDAGISLPEIEKFYPDGSIRLRAVTSAATGDGLDILFQTIADAAQQSSRFDEGEQLVLIEPQRPGARRKKCRC
jgi:small GTP-binding protein